MTDKSARFSGHAVSRTDNGGELDHEIRDSSVQNGAVLRVESEDQDSCEEIVYQAQEDAETEAFADFLRHLVEHYGPPTGRYHRKGSPSGLILGQIRATRVIGCAQRR